MKKENKNPVNKVKYNIRPLKVKLKQSEDLQTIEPLQQIKSIVLPSKSPERLQESSQNLMLPILTGLQQIITKMSKKREDLQVRDRQYIIDVPQGNSYAQKKTSIKKWLQKVVSNTLSIGFNYYLKDQLTYEQLKVYCSQNILKNVAILTQKYRISAEEFKQIDEFFRDDVIALLLKKYPLTQSIIVNKALEALAKAPDESKSLSNDFLYQSKIAFSLRDNENYDDLIKTVINEIIIKTNKPNNIMPEFSSSYLAFQKTLKQIFQIVQEKQQMKPNPLQKKGTLWSRQNLLQKKNVEQVLLRRNNNQQAQIQKRQYRQKVKEYTHYLIGRKLSENISVYSAEELVSRNFDMKSPAVLRILTKWCQELWEKFIPKNYFLNKKGDFPLANGEVKTLSPEMRSNLDKLMQTQKVQIKRFMEKLIKESYSVQLNLLNQLLQNTDDQFYEENLQKVSGKFSVLIGMSLQKWIVKYLNRLLHGLLKVAHTFHQLYYAKEWPCPPSLLTFGIGDLMRCKCSSQEREIIRMFEQIKNISDRSPKILKIIRIKNRLNLGTNDILINLRFGDQMTCEVQLAINTKKSKFIKASNGVSHYLYELQRSLFGPINQLCSIQRSLDLRSAFYSNQVTNEDNKISSDAHKCQVLNKSFDLQVVSNPFICSICAKTYSQNNLIFDHVKCSQCSFWKCGKCYSKSLSFQMLKKCIFIDEKINKKCISRFQRKFQTDELPKYGVIVNWFKKDKIVPIIFKRFLIKGITYLFSQQNNQIKQILKLDTQNKQQVFSNNNLIFQLNSDDEQSISPLTEIKIQQQFFLPQYVRKCYLQQKDSINLQNEPLTSALFQKVFNGSQMEKSKIQTLSLINTKIQQINSLQNILPQLKVLNLVNNKQLKQYSSLMDFKQLRQLCITNCIIGQQLPKQILYIQTLQKLSLKNNQLQIVPSSICELKNLKQLYISKDQNYFQQLNPVNYYIREFPIQLFFMIKLQILDVSYQLIYNLPEQIGNLKQLRSLNVKHNNLKKLPESIYHLKQLQYINFQQNPIEALPSCLSNIKHFNRFQLKNIGFKINDHHNKDIIYYKSVINELPHDLEQITKLTVLDVHSRNLHTLPSLKKCHNLQVINLQACSFNSLPDIGQCLQLKQLNMKQQNSQNQYDGLSIISPQFFKKAPNAEILNFMINRIQNIPQQIGSLTQLTVLKLQINNIAKLPEEIGYCVNLRQLYLWRNRLTELPQSMKNLNNLKILNAPYNKIASLENLMNCCSLQKIQLENNLITQIPRKICNLVNVENLSLWKNKIQMLPKELGQLRRMKETELILKQNPIYYIQCMDYVLRYGDNQTKGQIKCIKQGGFNISCYSLKLQQISSSIQYATHLKSINISNHELSNLPQQFGALINLKELNISSNLFSVFPLSVTKCVSLKSINISKNKIQDIPSQFERLCNLSQINFEQNELKTLPIEINRCAKLTNLNCQSNKIQNLKDQIFEGLQDLQIIIFNHNKLINFPKGLLSCKKLVKIHLNNNKIQQFCGDFTKLQALNVLQCGNNQLTQFPQVLTDCRTIQTISLSNNKITNISQNIGKLQQLNTLQLQSNKITKIPANLSQCKKLGTLNLGFNLIQVVPAQLQVLQNIYDGWCILNDNPLKQVNCLQWLKAKGSENTRQILNNLHYD